MNATCRGLANAVLLSAAITASVGAVASEQPKPAPLVIQDQGSFAVGGTVITNPGTFDTFKPTPEGQVWFNTFRIGVWPKFFPGVQFSQEPETLNQFFRSMTPNTGPFDIGVITDAVSALFNKTGPAILVTHSQSGGPGWVAAMK